MSSSCCTKVCSDEYLSITTKINELLSSNQQALISIFTDETESQYVLDNIGNEINNLQITSLSKTDCYIDPVTNERVCSCLKIKFINDGEFINIDDDDNYYYQINGIDFPVRNFGFTEVNQQIDCCPEDHTEPPTEPPTEPSTEPPTEPPTEAPTEGSSV
jgi:hypothetical protein